MNLKEMECGGRIPSTHRIRQLGLALTDQYFKFLKFPLGLWRYVLGENLDHPL